MKNKDNMYLWTLIFNVVLFCLACLFLLVAQWSSLKPFLVVAAIGILLVNLHSFIRWRIHKAYRKSLEIKQTENIVPNYCPDYWQKVKTGTNSKCKNEFVSDNKVYTFGDEHTPKEYDLNKFSHLTNQQKCWNISKDNVAWMDLQMQCEAYTS